MVNGTLQMNPPGTRGGRVHRGRVSNGRSERWPESGGAEHRVSNPTEVTGVKLNDSTRGAEMNHPVLVL